MSAEAMTDQGGQFIYVINVLLRRAAEAAASASMYRREAENLDDLVQKAQSMTSQRERDADQFLAAARALGWEGGLNPFVSDVTIEQMEAELALIEEDRG